MIFRIELTTRLNRDDYDDIIKRIGEIEAKIIAEVTKQMAMTAQELMVKFAETQAKLTDVDNEVKDGFQRAETKYEEAEVKQNDMAALIAELKAKVAELLDQINNGNKEVDYAPFAQELDEINPVLDKILALAQSKFKV